MAAKRRLLSCDSWEYFVHQLKRSASPRVADGHHEPSRVRFRGLPTGRKAPTGLKNLKFIKVRSGRQITGGRQPGILAGGVGVYK